jgi:hypothetical protein
MQLTRKPIIYVCMILLAGSCIEPYFPKDLEYEPMLFIQAIVSDNPAVPSMVILSNSSPFTQNPEEQVPYIITNSAVVYVEKDDGTRYNFEETSIWGGYTGGRYRPSVPIPLTLGSGYRLVVETYDQHRFESDYEVYWGPTEIEDIGFRHTSEQITELGRIEQGYRFNISTSAEGEEPAYFRWTLDHTYRYYAPLQATHTWTGSNQIYNPSNDYTYCYKDGIVKGIYIGSTAGLTEGKVIESPLHFVSQYGDQLLMKYSLHAYQYRISQSAFIFWNDLRTLLYETGGLYETQPFKLTGNIRRTSDRPVNVAGVFEVAGISEKRVYVPRPTEFLIMNSSCIPETVRVWGSLAPGSYLIDVGDNVFQTAPAICFDCRLKGGYTAKPYFWEE